MALLDITGLHAGIEDSPILKGIDLKIEPGTVHAIMGPNGSGKSTLSYVLAGRDDYEVTGGSIRMNDQDLLEMEADERARNGLFLAFQYPVEVPGVSSAVFLRHAYNAHRKGRGEDEMDNMAFIKLLREKAAHMEIDADMLKRPVNVGFSGGEKKRNEMLHMSLLEPRLCVLDETDSGLDIDALKIVSQGVNAMRSPERSFLIITHYQRLLDYIVPDIVHVMAEGRIVKSGDKSLALELEKDGYAAYVKPQAA